MQLLLQCTIVDRSAPNWVHCGGSSAFVDEGQRSDFLLG
jgi:hypothetical protein